MKVYSIKNNVEEIIGIFSESQIWFLMHISMQFQAPYSTKKTKVASKNDNRTLPPTSTIPTNITEERQTTNGGGQNRSGIVRLPNGMAKCIKTYNLS